MCKAFAHHLLGDGFLEEATRALEKSSAYVPKPKGTKMDNFAVLRPGSIDYTPHHETIRLIIDAMDQKRICKIIYHSPGRVAPKTFFIMPLKLFSHNESLYLHAGKATLPDKNEKAGYDPLLAVHRMIGVELTARNYEFPVDYDFEKVFNQEFGVIKDDPFLAEVHFTGFAAVYISERIWSPDQKIEKFDDESIKLVFKTSSIPETVSWILSFDQEATVIKPDWLKEKIKSLIDHMRLNYH
jgi:predicted DNA-binding transcriptional regulator YafY